MNSSLVIIIILILIIASRYKSISSGKKKKVTLSSLIILPLFIIYAFYSSMADGFQASFKFTFLAATIFGVCAFIGIITGIIRAKFYNLEIDRTTGDIYSSSSMGGLIFFICLIAIKIIFRFAFGFAPHSILNLINDGLLIMTVLSILIRRIVLLIKYFQLTSKYTN